MLIVTVFVVALLTQSEVRAARRLMIATGRKKGSTGACRFWYRSDEVGGSYVQMGPQAGSKKPMAIMKVGCPQSAVIASESGHLLLSPLCSGQFNVGPQGPASNRGSAPEGDEKADWRWILKLKNSRNPHRSERFQPYGSCCLGS